MFSWRITKYNPIYRNERGYYLKDEWILYSQIGDLFEGKEFTLDEYLQVEARYVRAIELFMNYNEIDELKVTGLEKNQWDVEFSPIDDVEIYHFIKDGHLANKEFIFAIARLILRDKLWCRLESEKTYVHFGWDYYMYFGSKKTCKPVLAEIEQIGLFVEKHKSPYHTRRLKLGI